MDRDERYEMLRGYGFFPTGETYVGPICVVDMATIGSDDSIVVACKSPNHEARRLGRARHVITRENQVLEALSQYLPDLPVPNRVAFEEDESILVTERFPGRTLLRRIGRRPSINAVAEAIFIYSEALMQLHEVGYLQGDVHFSNVLDYDRGSLIDLATSGTPEEHSKGIALRHASPFSPPEFYNEEPFTYASDVFSLGLCAFSKIMQIPNDELSDIIEAHGFGPILSMLSKETSDRGILNNDLGLLLSCMMDSQENRPDMPDVHKASKNLRYLLSS